MCSRTSSSLPTLPVEILHHIFDELDAQPIVLGLARTCQRLRAVVKSYDRYRLDFEWLSKSDFKLMCHLVDPQNVISLTLSHADRTPDRIELFLTLFKTRELTRLRTLKLRFMEERFLAPILKSIPFQPVTSFSVNLLTADGRRLNPTNRFLSSAVDQTKLCQLNVTFGLERLQKILWCHQTQLEYLSMGKSVHWYSMSEILAQLPHLRTLVLKDIGGPRSTRSNTLLPQIISFTFTDATLLHDSLELMLSSMPSLNYFKLIGRGDYRDGGRWEHFIKTRLPLLKKFEFFIKHVQIPRGTPAYIESVVTPYRTPFWLEQKKWFVTCEYSTNEPTKINLFSMPICVSSLKYKSEETKVSHSTGNLNHENDVTIMDSVRTVSIDVNSRTLKVLQIQVPGTAKKYPLFRKVEMLYLSLSGALPLHWASFVLALIDLTTIVELKIVGSWIRTGDSTILTELSHLLEQTCNLLALRLDRKLFTTTSALTAEHLCPMIPRRLNRLVTPVKNLDEVEKILDRLDHLSSLYSSFDHTPCRGGDIDWLPQRKRGSTCAIGSTALGVWVSNSNMPSLSTEVGTKRIKLTFGDHSPPGLEHGACQKDRCANRHEGCLYTYDPTDNFDDLFC